MKRIRKKAFCLMLALCVTAGSLPRTGYAGTAGRKAETERYGDPEAQERLRTGNGSNGEVSQSNEYPDIIHGFGTKIKEKQQKEMILKAGE